MTRSVLMISLLVLRLATGVLSAQGAPAASIRLLAFSRIGEEMEVSIAGPDAKVLDKDPLALPTQQLSPARKVTARALTFTAPGKPEKILGKVSLPATGNEFVLIFLPAAKNAATPYHIDAVALPASGFGSGDYAFVNYSGNPVGCVIDGEKLPVANGKSVVYHPLKSGKGAGNRTMVCYEQKQGVWETTPFFSSRIIVQEGVRNLILICVDPRTGLTDFRGITDFVDG